MTKYQEIISWLEQSGYSPSGLMTMTIENLAHTIESYNHHKVNELNKSDVIKSGCECKIELRDRRDSELKYGCFYCGEEVKQTVL